MVVFYILRIVMVGQYVHMFTFVIEKYILVIQHYSFANSRNM